MDRKKRKIHYAINRLQAVIRKQKVKITWKSLPAVKKSPPKRSAPLTLNPESATSK